MYENSNGGGLAGRARALLRLAAAVATVPMTLSLLALSDPAQPAAQVSRVDQVVGSASARAPRGQTLVPPPATAPPAAEPTEAGAQELSVRRARGNVTPATTATPPTDPPVVDATVPPPAPDLTLMVAGALAIYEPQIKPRTLPIESEKAPRLEWSLEEAASVLLVGPGVMSAEKSDSIVPCPGEIKNDKCRYEAGVYTYTLIATDEFGRTAATSVNLEVGVANWSKPDDETTSTTAPPAPTTTTTAAPPPPPPPPPPPAPERPAFERPARDHGHERRDRERDDKRDERDRKREERDRERAGRRDN